MNDKISIILPIFNVGPHLRKGIDSLLNQSIGKENLEIIMVDDCSTDGSGDIIDEYADKYDSCIAIHLEENTGSANGPRNRGIEESTGNYVMFLDPDDSYTKDACKTLLEASKKYSSDISFGRFRRIYTQKKITQKSYSPYLDDLKTHYPDEKFYEANPLNVSDEAWERIFKKIVYGRDIIATYEERNNEIDTIYVEKIEDEPDLLKVPPSVWTKLYKRELVEDIRFPHFISGDDMAFNVETLLKANGIVFLNNFLCYDYYIRDFEDDKSITNNVNVRLLKDLMDSYIYCRKLTEGYSTEIQNTCVNPHLLYWTSTWKGSKFTKNENRELLEKVNYLKSIHNNSLKSKLLLSSISTMIESKLLLQR